MNTNELKEKIEQQQVSIQAKKKELAEIRQRIVEDLKPFLKGELKKNVESVVIDNPGHTKELERERLVSMKQELSDLLNRSEGLVEEIYNDDAFWFYTCLEDSKDNITFNDEKYAFEKMDEGIKLILGEAGRLLQKYDYIQIGSGMYSWKNNSHRDFNFVRGNDPYAPVYFRGYVPKPDSLTNLISEYVQKITPLHQAYIDLSKLNEELSKQEAADLWNEI